MIDPTEVNKFKNYRKVNVQPMRPYILGEDMTGISVNKEDTPEVGGMIAVNVNNSEDRWYIAKNFFAENYEELINVDPNKVVETPEQKYFRLSKLVLQKANPEADLSTFSMEHIEDEVISFQAAIMELAIEEALATYKIKE